MPELPEIYHIAGQMNSLLPGKTITKVEVKQEKCLNTDIKTFSEIITGVPIESINSRGKWLFIRFINNSYLLISLGMGGDLIFHAYGETYDGKYQFKFILDDGSFIHLYFSWFGYVHALNGDELNSHKMTENLGICPLSDAFTCDNFLTMLIGKRGGIKSYLMNQHNIAGIGNVYIQDILFKSRLHPNRKIETITMEEQKALYLAITQHLRYAAELGGLIYERDFLGQNGRYTYDLIGHKPGKSCPICQTPVKEIRTGGTRSYICEKCQPLTSKESVSGS